MSNKIPFAITSLIVDAFQHLQIYR